MASSSREVEAPARQTGEEAQPLPARKSGSRARAWTFRIVGTLLFIAFIIWLDMRGALPLDQVWGELTRANLLLVALSIALYVPFLIVKAARWRLLSADMRMPMKWGDAWRVYAIGLAAGTFTPGQAGDAIKAWYMQRMGHSLARGLGSSVVDRLFDVAALALLGLLGIAVYGQRFAGQTPALVGLVVLCALGVGFIAWNRTRTWAVNLVTGMLAARLKRAGTRSDESAQAWTFTRSTVTSATLLTVASFATSVFRVWLLAAALGIWLGPLEVCGFVGLTTAAALVPVTVGGIGTRDVVAALAFTQIHLAAAEGTAVSVLILVLNLAQAIAGWLVWLRHRA